MDIYGLFVPTYVIVGAVVAFLYLVVAPLAVSFVLRQPALPEILPVDPGVELPEDVRAYFYNCHESMTSIGFENVGTFSLPNQISNVKVVLILFVNRERRTSAMSTVFFVKAADTWSIHQKSTEFSTNLAEHGHVDTTNSREVGAFPVRPKSITTQHPEITDLRTLHAAHDAILDEHFPGHHRTLRLYEQFDGDGPAYIATTMTEELEAARAAGYLRLVGGDQVKFDDAMTSGNPYQFMSGCTPPRYHGTIKGSCLAAWKQCWPIKPIVNRLRYAHDRRLLEATGFTWNRS